LTAVRSIFMLTLWAFLLSGCAVWPEPTRSMHVGATGVLGGCAEFFAMLDRQIVTADAIDAGYTRVEHHPYLRTDRFIASFRNEVDASPAFAAWVDHMQALDMSARRFEIASLSGPNIAALASVNTRDELVDRIRVCGNLLKSVEFSDVGQKERLRQDAAARDEYIPLRRILGVSPITDMFVSQGVKKWHAKARERFGTQSQADLDTIRYTPAVKPDALAVSRIIQRAERDALGIPAYSSADQTALFHTYAPIWEITTQDDDDRIGSPVWTADGRIDVDTDRPQTYTHLSFTRFGSDILTQLNFIIWFPSRPKDGRFDIYAGLLDGLNYRVTLDTDGKPILFETMHNCGCYYKAYPTHRLQVRETMAYAEPPLIFSAPGLNASQASMVVAMAHRTHYVNRLYPLLRKLRTETVAYSLSGYGDLKRLPYPDGTRKSMFNRYGIVPGSQRLERYFLWPTGVLSPGAMRQWGKHAVAFIGRRHFDDPFYLDEMFKPDRTP
jgi:hypothetical protein